MFVVNASWTIRLVWKIVEAFIDPMTRLKIILSASSAPDELLALVHKEQLPREYGGVCDFPSRVWPPILPKGRIRDDPEAVQLPEEEFKQQLLAEPKMMPSPELADYVRVHRAGPNRKGHFPHKTFYLLDRIERRDSFNGLLLPEPTCLPAPPDARALESSSGLSPDAKSRPTRRELSGLRSPQARPGPVKPRVESTPDPECDIDIEEIADVKELEEATTEAYSVARNGKCTIVSLENERDNPQSAGDCELKPSRHLQHEFRIAEHLCKASGDATADSVGPLPTKNSTARKKAKCVENPIAALRYDNSSDYQVKDAIETPDHTCDPRVSLEALIPTYGSRPHFWKQQGNETDKDEKEHALNPATQSICCTCLLC